MDELLALLDEMRALLELKEIFGDLETGLAVCTEMARVSDGG